MFGSKEASEDKLKKMVEKGKWDKLRKQYLCLLYTSDAADE